MPVRMRPLSPLVPPSLRDVPICDGALVVSFPDRFVAETDKDGTTSVYDPTDDGAIVRFTVIGMGSKTGRPIGTAGEDHVRKMATAEHRELHSTRHLLFYEYSQRDDESATKAVMYYWVAGIDDRVVVTSCWAKRSLLALRSRSDVIAAARQAVKSLRRGEAKAHREGDVDNIGKLGLTPQHSAWLEQRHAMASEAMAQLIGGGERLVGDLDDLDRIQRFLSRSGVDSIPTPVLEGLGVAIGDLLARRLGLTWCTEANRVDSVPALRHKETGVIIHPTNLIIKQIEQGESPDARDLYVGVVRHMEEVTAGRSSDRFGLDGG